MKPVAKPLPTKKEVSKDPTLDRKSHDIGHTFMEECVSDPGQPPYRWKWISLTRGGESVREMLERHEKSFTFKSKEI